MSSSWWSGDKIAKGISCRIITTSVLDMFCLVLNWSFTVSTSGGWYSGKIHRTICPNKVSTCFLRLILFHICLIPNPCNGGVKIFQSMFAKSLRPGISMSFSTPGWSTACTAPTPCLPSTSRTRTRRRPGDDDGDNHCDDKDPGQWESQEWDLES